VVQIWMAAEQRWRRQLLTLPPDATTLAFSRPPGDDEADAAAAGPADPVDCAGATAVVSDSAVLVLVAVSGRRTFLRALGEQRGKDRIQPHFNIENGYLVTIIFLL
jgi:hypothetical protein